MTRFLKKSDGNGGEVWSLFRMVISAFAVVIFVYGSFLGVQVFGFSGKYVDKAQYATDIQRLQGSVDDVHKDLKRLLWERHEDDY